MSKKLKNLILSVLYFSLLLLLLPLQYDNISVWPFVFPILFASVFIVLYRALAKWPRTKEALMIITAITIVFLGFYYFIRIVHFCAYSDFGTVYVNRNDQSDTIVMKGYSCFLTDTDPELVEERKLTDHLKWVTEFTDKPVDPAKWQSVH